MGIPFNNLSTDMVLITPSDLREREIQRDKEIRREKDKGGAEGLMYVQT